jgi:hypothetical protein
MEWLSDVAAWAWERHHNEWSWYIRPLFLLPYCWFAWRRSLSGIALTLLALLTSMFWFPAPETPSPWAVDVLAAEKAYLLGPWNWWKVALALLVPASLGALAVAFWRRSFLWGVAVVNFMAIAKVAWTFVFFSQAAALYHLLPAVLGAVICNAVLAAAWWRSRARGTAARQRESPLGPPKV